MLNPTLVKNRVTDSLSWSSESWESSKVARTFWHKEGSPQELPVGLDESFKP